MHKERIIAGIEKVFEGYAFDKELKEALRESHSHSNARLQLFPKNRGSHFLGEDGAFYVRYDNSGGGSSARSAAQDFFDYFCSGCKPPVTLTKAKAMLKADLGERVKALKKDYAQQLNNGRNRRIEGYYTQ